MTKNRVSQAPVSGLPRRPEYRLLAMTNSINRVSPNFMKKEKVDLILYGGTVLTVDREDRAIEDGAVAVADGKIAAIGSAREIAGSFFAPEKIDAKGDIIMPGLINTHTHLAMSIFRGVADDAILGEWLSEYIFPLEDKFVNKDSAYWGSLLACAEMILSGTTAFCDMYFFEKETGRAAEKIGMRGVIGEGIATVANKDKEIWKKKRTLSLELMKKFKNSNLISVGIKPHSPYACTPHVLKEAKGFAEENNLLYVIHLAETKKEYTDFMKNKKMTPVQYLDWLGVLNENTLTAHAVWMGKNDFEILRDRRVKISHCPQSNMKLGSGIAPIAKMLRNNITVSLGTDGAASNNALDMFCEMKNAALLAKVAALDASALSAKETVRMATIEGAKALGKEDEIGSLETGKKADIIIINKNRPHLTPIYDYYSHLAYCAIGSDISDSIIDGKVVMRKRKIQNIDIDEVMEKINTISSYVKKTIKV